MAVTTALSKSLGAPATACRLVRRSCGLVLPRPQSVVPGTTTIHEFVPSACVVRTTLTTPLEASSSSALSESL